MCLLGCSIFLQSSLNIFSMKFHPFLYLKDGSFRGHLVCSICWPIVVYFILPLYASESETLHGSLRLLCKIVYIQGSITPLIAVPLIPLFESGMHLGLPSNPPLFLIET